MRTSIHITLALIISTFARPTAAQVVQLPSHEPLFVLQGGDTQNVNMHMSVASQAFGVDFAVVGGVDGRALAAGKQTALTDFYCYGSAVLSPATGTVVAAVDSLPDNSLGTHDTAHPLGNHVIVSDGERFIYIAHLQRGSVRVATGAAVLAGSVIGACGNSGNSDFPHIHVHATNSARFGEATGLNLQYGPMSVELAGEHFANVSWPLLRGLWVRATNPR